MNSKYIQTFSCNAHTFSSFNWELLVAKTVQKTDCKVRFTYILTTVDDKPLSRYLE